MKSGKLEMAEFNALNYLSEQKTPIDILTINSVQVLCSQQFIDSFRIISLPPNVVVLVKSIPEELAKPEEIVLVEKSMSNGQVYYQITEDGRKYVEYYKEYELEKA